MPKTTKRITLSKIRCDQSLQARAETNAEAVEDYAEILDKLPPMVVYDDGETLWLSEGFHRYAAHKNKNRAQATVEVRKGSRLGALVNGIKSNDESGLRFTRRDRRRAVELLLVESPEMGVSVVSEVVGVGATLVRTIRSQLTQEGKTKKTDKRIVKRGGTTFEMDTKKIGSGRKRSGPSQKTQEIIAFDSKGRQVPDCVAPVFADLIHFDAIGDSLDTLLSDIGELSKLKSGAGNGVNAEDLANLIGHVRAHLDLVKPHIPCPSCVGRGKSEPVADCARCAGSGYITRAT